MPQAVLIVCILLIVYLIGAIPFGLAIGKAFFKIDPREHGSKNIGATNVYRVIGWKAGAPVFALDLGKGLIPVLLMRHAFPSASWWIILTGFAAIMGHTYSPFLGFKGGKGVATSLGVAFGLSWQGSLVCFFTWLAIVLTTGYVSLASIAVTPLGAVLVYYLNDHNVAYGVFGAIITVFVIVKHRANIKRLIHGEELKTTFGKKKAE
ncbi:MAG: glycerol-3-phosphate 1-O-acyltransferase PlsY [Capsulimonadaceae bacterium]|nr:glycerol-3-phosphate 1-O-acyltransferase PlsY [Capsulimonadaceae bacterium]